MAVSAEYLASIEERLAPLGEVRSRRMFGGAGIFHGGQMFALIADEQLYFKVDASNRADYEAAGSGPFVYAAANGRQTVMSYWQVPDDVLEGADALLTWARKAIAVALAAVTSKPRPRKAPGGRPTTARSRGR